MKPKMMLWSACALALAGCGAGSPAEERVRRAEAGEGEVVIGAPWPWASRGEVQYGRGIDMAVAELNAAGGIGGRRLRVAREDDHETVDEGRQVAQRLAEDPQVVAVVGHLQSYVTVPAAAIYDMAGVVMLAPTATDPQLTELGYRNVFRTIFTDKDVGTTMADHAADAGSRRVAIFYMRDNYGRELANAFEERANARGVRVVGRQSCDAGTPVSEATLGAALEEWKGQDVDAVFLAVEPRAAAQFAVAAARAGIRARLLGGDALGSPEYLRMGGAAVEGTVVASAFHPGIPAAEAQRFTRAFRARYGTEPDAGAALGYDAIRLLASAMQRAGSTVPAQVAEALRAPGEWNGATGGLSFDASGNLRARNVVKTVVRGGRFEYLAPTAAAGSRVAVRD